MPLREIGAGNPYHSHRMSLLRLRAQPLELHGPSRNPEAELVANSMPELSLGSAQIRWGSKETQTGPCPETGTIYVPGALFGGSWDAVVPELMTRLIVSLTSPTKLGPFTSRVASPATRSY